MSVWERRVRCQIDEYVMKNPSELQVRYEKALDWIATLDRPLCETLLGATYETSSAGFEAEIESAASRGLELQESFPVEHDSAISNAIELVPKVDHVQLGNAFICGLAPSQIRWRAPMQAYGAIMHMESHCGDYDEEMWTPLCRVCGAERITQWNPVKAALQAHMSGYIERTPGEAIEVVSSNACLGWFVTTEKPEVDPRADALFQSVLDAIAVVPPTTTAVQLAKLLKPVLGKDRHGVAYLLETLGLLGVLVSPEDELGAGNWVNWCERKYGKGRNQEMLPPACHWRREHGLAAERLNHYFPRVAIPRSLRR